MVSDVRSAAVPTGVGNTMGNKGGVGIHFAVGQTSFVVVNSHLAAHQNAVKARNADFKLISRGIPVALSRKIPGRTSPKLAADIASRAEKKEEGSEMVGEGVSRAKRESKMDRESKDDRPQLHACADRVVFMGDLNYRIRGNRAAVSALLRQGMRDVLLNNDQLTWSRQQGLALNHFTEPPLNFRPTYKFDVGPDIDTDSYDTGPKKRIPAWTDRILYASGSGPSFEQTPPGMSCTAYNADMSLRSSDHRPVYASFRAQVDVGDMVEAAAVAEGKEGNGDACGANKEVPAFSSESQVCSIM
jgi:phosphatidylinositol-bisphosphatase